MFIGKKNKVHAILDPPSKTIPQPDHQQLSKILQQVSGQLDLMLELQQQQQAKNSYDMSESCKMNSMNEHDQCERLRQCQQQQQQQQDSCQVSRRQTNLYCNHQKHHQQCSASPSLSSFFSLSHQPQNQCISICPHDTLHQKSRPCCHHYYQPSYGCTFFQQSHCSNSVIRDNQQFYCHPQQYYHHCASMNNGHDPCSCTNTVIPTAITSPQTTTISQPPRDINVPDSINHTTNSALDTQTSFGQSSYCRNNNTHSTTYPLSVASTTTTVAPAPSTSTRTKSSKSNNYPPFPGMNSYYMDTNTDTITATDHYYNNDDNNNNNIINNNDDDDEQQQRRHRGRHQQRRQLHHPRTSPPLFSAPLTNILPSTSSSPSASPASPPPLPLRTENLSRHRHPYHQHQHLSWTDIYRQDLLSRQDALISPSFSSCNNINAIHINKVKKTKSSQSYLGGWWIHGKYKWNQLRKKKFSRYFR